MPNFSSLMTHDTTIKLSEELEAYLKKTQPCLELEDLTNIVSHVSFQDLEVTADEYTATTQLIIIFDALFAKQRVRLVRSENEPEYFPIKDDKPARIEFAHGFFASALHEISHWCIAGNQRRLLKDFGYWYAADGRNENQQRAFEHVEIKPQALECLFTLACQRPFQVSQDNLFADFDTTTSTFDNDVYQQAKYYINNPNSLPRDAKYLLLALLIIFRHR